MSNIIGCVLSTNGDINYINYDTPKDYFKHRYYTICGANVEIGLVLVQQEDIVYQKNNRDKIVNNLDSLTHIQFVRDEYVYGPIFIMQTDNNGEPINFDKNLVEKKI